MAVVFRQLEAHERLKRVLLPVGKPCESEQVRGFDLPVLSLYGGRPVPDAITTHHPLSARA